LNNFSKIEKIKNNSSKFVYVKGIPIIAIHGTHEHRGRDFVNALDILEKSNSLVHIHAGYAKLEKEFNGEKELVFIHGLGGIPEKMAKQALEKYSPKPISSSTNLLLLHQSFKEFLPFDDESIATLSLTDLPEGFDLIINGHLHWINEQDISKKKFLLCGSTIYTQMKKLESEKEKGIFLFDTISKKIDFVPFEKQRKLFYEKMKFENALPEDILKKAEDKINEILSNNFEIKPLIRLKLVGTIAKGFSQKDVQIKTSDKAIFSITKNFSVEEFKKRINDLKEIQKQKKSVIEFGIELLENKVLESNLSDFDTRRIFELLSEDQIEKVEELLLNKKK
jgi:DNA repair exonuclease SbcCD nuclease subunit